MNRRFQFLYICLLFTPLTCFPQAADVVEFSAQLDRSSYPASVPVVLRPLWFKPVDAWTELSNYGQIINDTILITNQQHVLDLPTGKEVQFPVNSRKELPYILTYRKDSVTIVSFPENWASRKFPFQSISKNR